MLEVLLILAAGTSPDSPLAAFGWMKELAGSCWTTTLPDGQTRDTQCYEARHGRFLFGRIEIGTRFQGESLFAWDEDAKKIVFYFWGSNGRHGVGEGRFEGELIHFPEFTKRDPAAPESRSTWSQIGPDAYRVSRQERSGDAWSEKWAVTYTRVK
jgi:hypothetical protein